MVLTDLTKIRYYGQKRSKRNWAFRSFLKGYDITEDEMDAIVHKLTENVWSQIDCTACANCCLEMKPGMTLEEIERIATFLRTPKETLTKDVFEKDDSEELYYAKKSPCPFLAGKKCSIYEIRPQVCRTYPHLLKSEFLSRLIGVVENYSVCPIVFNVYEQLKKRLNFPAVWDVSMDSSS